MWSESLGRPRESLGESLKDLRIKGVTREDDKDWVDWSAAIRYTMANPKWKNGCKKNYYYDDDEWNYKHKCHLNNRNYTVIIL